MLNSHTIECLRRFVSSLRVARYASQLVLTTEPQAPDLREFLKYIYDTCYVECVVKNPLYKLGEPFTCVRRRTHHHRHATGLAPLERATHTVGEACSVVRAT